MVGMLTTLPRLSFTEACPKGYEIAERIIAKDRATLTLDDLQKKELTMCLSSRRRLQPGTIPVAEETG